MSENNETHEQIVAELRDLSRCAKQEVLLPTVYGKPLDVYFAELADRLEAATQREREATGNSAALRKALITLRENLHVEKIDGCACGPTYIGPTVCAFTLIDAALAAPARNCDKGTVAYQTNRLRKFCNSMKWCDRCPLYKLSIQHVHKECKLLWAQLPYDESERGDESPRTEQESEVQG